MRAHSIYWTFIILLFVSTNIFAQKSAIAVMNVSVSVISGSTLTDVQNVDINFNESTINTGGFEITTPNYVDTLIENDPTVTLTNQFGEEITLQSNAEIVATSSTKSIDIGAKLTNLDENLRGNYTGSITTTIAYF